jgi:hypothetical protein
MTLGGQTYKLGRALQTKKKSFMTLSAGCNITNPNVVSGPKKCGYMSGNVSNN